MLAGHRAPLYEPGGRELKAQVFPDQLHTWFGLPLAVSGRATVLLFPTVKPGTTAACLPQSRGLVEADFFGAKTEDRYPDIFGLALASPCARERDRTIANERLSSLPHFAVNLGYDVTVSNRVLNTILTSI